MLVGDNGNNTLVGDASDQTLIGMGGQDVLYGFGCADTFVFNDSAPSNFDVIADFESGVDHIGVDHTQFASINLEVGTYALGDEATFYWDVYDHTLNCDVDGFGGAAGVRVSYIPGVTVLNAGDLIFV